MEYAQALTRQLGIGAPFGRLAEETFHQLCDLGFEQANESAVIEIARQRPPNA